MRAALRDVRGRLGKNIRLLSTAKKSGPRSLCLRSIRARQRNRWLIAEAGIPEADRALKAAAALLRIGAARRLNIAPSYSNGSRPSWIAVVSSFPRWKFSKSAKPGRKRTATSARRWISCLFYAHEMRLHRSTETDPARSRRRKLSALLATRSRARHRAVEFSCRDSLRDGLGRARYRQHRHHETGRTVGGAWRIVDGDF